MSPRTKEQFEQIRQERREQILEAARQVFAERGFHATRMSDIAREADVSQGTLYHYYSGKDDLFIALFSAWAERLEQVVGEVAEAGLSATDKLDTVIQMGLAYLRADEDLLPVFVEYWAYALRNTEAAASFRSLFQAIQQTCAAIIEEGIANGEFKSIDVQTLSALPLVILDGITVVFLILGRELVNPEWFIVKTQELVFEGLLA